MASTGYDVDERSEGEQPPRTDEEAIEGHQSRVDGEDLRQGEQPHPEIGVNDLQALPVSHPEQPLRRDNVDIKGKRKMFDIDLNVVPVSDPQASTSSAAAELLQGGRQAQLQSDLTPGSPRITSPRTQRRINDPLHFLCPGITGRRTQRRRRQTAPAQDGIDPLHFLRRGTKGRRTQRRRRQAASSTQEYNRHLVDPARASARARSQEQAQDGINPLRSPLPPPHSAANLYPPGTPGRNEPQFIQFSAQGPAVPSENFMALLQQSLARGHQHLYAPRPDRYFTANPPVEVQSRFGPASAGLQHRHRAPIRPQSRPQPQQTRPVSYPATAGSNIISRAPSIELYARRTPLPDPRARRWIADPQNGVLSPFQQRPDLERRRTTPLQQNNYTDRHRHRHRQSLYNQGTAMMQNETIRASTAGANEHVPLRNHVNRLPQEQFMEAIMNPTSASLGGPTQNPRRQSVHDTILPSHQASTDVQNQLVQRADHVDYWLPQDRFMEANMRPPTQNPRISFSSRMNCTLKLKLDGETRVRQIDGIQVLRMKTVKESQEASWNCATR
ncbi:hypothetical protein GOP47_0022732 [Adiantum capillus-veneris]|uniref:Uncharacterized protein n=1 Tax=Adiantum capillus-veneris TaxID=13818 RepID=A0A9D4U717_ADICA|nr:hypothetical protein GOP47_0022732 [Adiantum capillus-veneris]